MKNISVIGAGTMGNGIAHVFAQYGFQVSHVDLSNDRLDKALRSIASNLARQVKKEQLTEGEKQAALDRINTYVDLGPGVAQADLVIEAVAEDLDLKRDIFKKLDELCPPAAILASNTSSISITSLGAGTKRPDRVIGMHFMNPVPIMRLVEVIRGFGTSDMTCQAIMALSRQIQKDPVEVQDYPGFVANRILMPMINEAIYTLYEGVSGVEQIDTVMRMGMAHPMGPLQLADFIGLDVCLSILKVLYQGFANPKYAPCPLLVKMVEAGFTGVKAGEGFYVYQNGYKDFTVSPRFN
ncbi:3-hydroxybutyryl-CoA dehydrogenase [Lunatimonas salinarum]|uniref:3-hydroxybutyryl-CoA dehydrogenase n=1 Tax=Lunatimonas salinarum TaxID=1774590 RepID=UPI001AE0037A|nr:3-hydroxybutyryl-CoA dehydrogenase [Lunatimonas salinarum]